MNILNNILSDQFVYALGWTLIHSLWQGALIGLVVAVAMILLHKYTARLRYFIYSISLFVIAALAVVTFISSFNSYNAIEPATTSMASMKEASPAIGGNVILEAVQSEYHWSISAIIDKTAIYCRTHIPLFVSIWLLGMLAFMLRFLGGYAMVRRYRHHRVSPVMGIWEQRFNELAQRSGVKRRVRLLESALIKVPMAIGYLKPVILLPLGALNGVPAQQMEAILAHELAHIRRRDYLVNLIQSLLEVIFFYHPVVWWLSSNIRIERENICDDIAIYITGNTMEFAKALSNIQEINLMAPGLAAGLSGKNKNRLINRIRRLSGKPKLHSGFAEGFIAVLILVISLIGLSAAAMITYPVEPSVDMQFELAETNSVLPILDYSAAEETVLPDTIKKEEQKTKVKVPETNDELFADSIAFSEKEAQQIMEMKAAIEYELEQKREAIEMEMEAVKAELERAAATEFYKDTLQDAQAEREEYLEQMGKAMLDYQRAMEDVQLRLQEKSWSIPRMHYDINKHVFVGGDSTVWSYEYPDTLYFKADSIREFYLQNWQEYLPELEEITESIEAERLEFEEQWREVEPLYERRPVEPLPAYSYVGRPHFEYAPFDRGRNLISDELRADDLIEYGRDYIVVIGKKQMLINGEKQSRSIFKKYRRLVDSLDDLTAIEDEDGLKIHIKH